MLTLFSWCAVALYLLPVAIALHCMRRRGASEGMLAVAIPAVVAVDLIAILLSCWLLRLEQAVFAVRAAWLALPVALHYLTKNRPKPPSVSRVRWHVPIALGAAAALLSAHYSHRYSIWDRTWHIGLVPALRGQTLPFRNVYDYEGHLRYHFSGDVLAAVVQSLSFDVIHSDFALSLAHDAMFGLTGASLGLLFCSFKNSRLLGALVGLGAVLLNGPVTLLREPGGRPLTGYSILNFFTMSFRPHVSLSGLLFVGFMACVVLRQREALSARFAVPAVLAIVALLGIADETSTGLLGLALGATWLFYPRVLHAKRWVGAVALVGLGVAFFGTNLIVGASLAPGMPVQVVQRVPWRNPGYLLPPVPLASAAGRELLLFDLWSLPLVSLALLLLWRRSREREFGALFVFLAVLCVASFVGLTMFEFNRSPIENHRFATVALFVSVLLAVLYSRSAARGSLASLCLHAATLLPAFSTLAWLRLTTPDHLRNYLRPGMGEIDCRSQAAAHVNEPTRYRYVARDAWYLWGGCRPTITAGNESVGWGFPIDNVESGPAGLRILDARVGEQPLLAVCLADPRASASDPVCDYALKQALCRPAGETLLECTLSPVNRAAILGAKPR